MSYYSNAKNVTDNSLEKTFENILVIIHTKHSSGSDARLQMEAALSTLYTEITETLRAFPGYELGSFSIRYAAPKWLDSGSQLEGFHPDIAILTGDHGEEIVDQEPTEENLRVVRTVVGPSTEYLLGTNKTQDEVLTPAPGSTCVHATPSFTLHRQPHTKRGDVRFAYVLDLKKV